MKVEEIVANEIMKLNDGWCGDFVFEEVIYNLTGPDSEEFLKWVIDEFLPNKSDCKYFGIDRRVITNYYNSTNKVYQRNKKLKLLGI